MKKALTRSFGALISTIAILPPLKASAEAESWYLRSNFGLSIMSDQTVDSENIGSSDGRADITLGNGFTAGLGIGYQYNERWAAEFSWEYRSNDSETTLADGRNYSDGNYASNIFFVNGLYYFSEITEGLVPYVGAGLAWVQEVDIDLEADGEELSYTDDGDIGAQFFVGAEYRFTPNWALQAELRYQAISDITLDGEGADEGSFSGIDYQPITLQAAIKYNF